MDVSMCIEISLITESQCFHDCRVADNVIKNLSYPSIHEFVLTEYKGFQLATTGILLRSKISSFQLVEYSSSSGFIRYAYLRLQFTYPHLRKECLPLVHEQE